MTSDSDLQRERQAWRHDLNAHPEFGFEESRTAAFVAAELREFGRDMAEGVGGTVRVIFQPAEEWGRGALAMLDDGLMTRRRALRADRQRTRAHGRLTWEQQI